MDDMLEKLDAELANADDPLTATRIRAFKLRVKGYPILDIAEELGIAYGKAQASVQWCLKNLPAVYESVDEFRYLSLNRLEWQFRELMKPRVEVVDGTEVQVAPSESAHRAALAVQDMMAKLLGAYAPQKINAKIEAPVPTPDIATRLDAVRKVQAQLEREILSTASDNSASME